MLERLSIIEQAGISKSDPEDAVAGSSSTVHENPSNLKMFEREDWTLFRTVEGLQQKADGAGWHAGTNCGTVLDPAADAVNQIVAPAAAWRSRQRTPRRRGRGTRF
jgi:hypothetical protein